MQIEAKSAPAQRSLAFVLQHDLIGRPYRKGFDLEGALAAYRKAKELDAKDINISTELAKLYEYGEDGTLFGKGAKLNEAMDETADVLRTYGDDLLRELRAGPSETHAHIEEHLELVLTLCTLVLGEEETELLRRRSKVTAGVLV